MNINELERLTGISKQIFMAVDRQSVGWAAVVALFTFPYLIWLFWMYPKNR